MKYHKEYLYLSFLLIKKIDLKIRSKVVFN